MLRNYLVIAWRVLLRRKFFTFVSLFGITFTLVVLMLATATLEHVFGPHDPEVHGDRMLYVTQARVRGPHASRAAGAGYGFLDSQVRTLPGAERVSIASEPRRVASYREGRKIHSVLKRTDGEFWRILRFDFLEGGPFRPDDDRDANPVAVINRTTRERFFGDAPAVGRTIEAEGQSFRVVGVVRDVPITRLMAYSDIWVPIGTLKSPAYRKEIVGSFTCLVLARDRRDFPALKAEFDLRVRRYPMPDPKSYDRLETSLDTLFESVARDMTGGPEGSNRAPWLRILIAAAAVLFMTLPAINLVNLNLSRILERAPEIGVRKAFGATSLSLVGQFVVENVLLAAIGGVLAWGASAALLAALNASGLIPFARLQLNVRILGWGVLTALFFGVFSGVYPAWRMSRLHPVQALRGRLE
jgi:putative ABC transport system permease protein